MTTPHPQPPPDIEAVRALASSLRRDVEEIAGRIGERHLGAYPSMVAAAAYLEASLREAGYQVSRQSYHVDGLQCDNLAAELPGSHKAGEILVMGAHYDTVPGCPGANDNTTGVASTLALARALAGRKFPRTLRFVLFVNEEPPYFQTDRMGSRVYARACKQNGETIVGMFSLETMGCYSDLTHSQRYPPPVSWFYPDVGNFIAFVSDLGSRSFLSQVVGSFRSHSSFPVQAAALPGAIAGVGWSDHWSFWQEGYPALMVTDTAPFRYNYYHTAQDTPEKIDYDRLAAVVMGLQAVIEELAAG